MFACISLSLVYSLNNECEISKEINIQIDYLKQYIKKCISKSIMLECISLNPSVLIE